MKCFVIPLNLKVEKKTAKKSFALRTPAGWQICRGFKTPFQGARPDQVQARPLAVGLFFSQDALA